MTLRLALPQARPMLKPKIVVLGCGGAGGNAVNTMIQSELQGVEFVVANTDAQALAQSLAETRIQLGSTATQGLGAGSKPEVGRAAAEESLSEVLAAVENANLVFIAAGMGGGTGTGSAPVIAQAIREQGILTVAVVTKPFHFEGQHRMRVAERGIEELQANVDTLIIVPNQNLFRVANERTTFADAFKMADDVLYEGVRGISDLMVQPGLINLDFADVRALMTVMGKAMMGLGEGHGECRAIEAAEAAIANPLLEDGTMRGAKGVLINIAGGPDLTLFEVDEAANRIREEVDPDANIIFGSSFDPVLQGRIRVSVVATGIDPESVRLGQHPAGQQVAADPAAAAQPTRWATITPDAPGKATSIASDKAAAAPQPVPQRLTPTPVAAMHAHGPSAARPLPKPVAALRPNAPAASQPQAAHRPSAQPFAGQPVAMASPRPTAAAAYYPGQGSQGPSVDEGYDGYEGYEAFDAYAEDLPEGLAANPGYAADDYEAAAQQPAMMAAHHSAVHQGPTHQGPAHQGPAHQEAAYHEATRYGAVHAQAAPRMAPLAPQPQRQPTLRPVEPAALTAHANDRAAFHPDHQAEPRRGLARAGGLFQRLQQFSRNAGFGAEPEPSASYQEQPARAGYPGGPFAGPNGGPNGGPHGGPNGGGQRAARPAPAPMTQAAAHAGSQPGGQFVRPVPQQDYAAAAGYQQPAHRAISVSSLESHLPPVQAPREIEDDLLEIPAFLRRQAN